MFYGEKEVDIEYKRIKRSIRGRWGLTCKELKDARPSMQFRKDLTWTTREIRGLIWNESESVKLAIARVGKFEDEDQQHDHAMRLTRLCDRQQKKKKKS